MPETTTPSAADRPDQPTTAADVVSEVIKSVDAVSFEAYSGQTRQSILSLLERLVQADQGARLAVSGSAESSETAAHRQLIVDLLAPRGEQSSTGDGPSEQGSTRNPPM